MKIQIAFLLFHHHNPFVNKDTENQIRKLISGDAVPLSMTMAHSLSELGLKFRDQDGLVRLEEEVELLDQKKILAQTRSKFSLELQWSIRSTNDYLMEFGVERDSIAICMAEQQIAGKGRRGKVWVSPFGKNIYMSIGRYFARSTSGLMGLSLVIGSCLVRTLRELGFESVGLKWPNDIILEHGKLAGILVEIGSAKKGSTFVVMGVGINLQLNEADSRAIDQPWSVLDQCSIGVSRNDLAARLIDTLVPELLRFEKDGFETFHEEWNENNIYKGREVVILKGEERITGRDAGVDSSGNYLLETTTGIQVFSAGEVSLRLEG